MRKHDLGELAKIMLAQSAAFLAEKLKTEKRGDLFVAMNVSWGQMSAPGFADAVRDAIAKYSLPKNALVLELTEGDAVTDDDRAASRVFKSLKAAGAALAFDDFGAGFSCLTNLRKYDFDYLKIDKSFADDLEKGGEGAKIVRSLAGLGKDLGLKVIVEGVESKDAVKAALDMGCAYGQGYALGKPMEAAPLELKEDKKEAKKEPPKKTDLKLAEKDAVEAEASEPVKEAEKVEEKIFADNDDEEKQPPRWQIWRSREAH